MNWHKLVLILALHTSHTFDAYSTNHSIKHQNVYEANPIYKPFAGKKTMYIAENVQAGLEELIAYELNKHGHKKLARILISESISMEVGLGIHNLKLKQKPIQVNKTPKWIVRDKL